MKNGKVLPLKLLAKSINQPDKLTTQTRNEKIKRNQWLKVNDYKEGNKTLVQQPSQNETRYVSGICGHYAWLRINK